MVRVSAIGQKYLPNAASGYGLRLRLTIYT